MRLSTGAPFTWAKWAWRKFYERMLHGAVGYQNVETNAHGRVLRVLERYSPKTGGRPDPASGY